MKTLLTFVFSFLLVGALNAQQQKVYEHDYLVKVGDMAPDFEVKYVDGTVKKLSDFRGKVVMLQFTASWCSVCRKEMPHIEEKVWKRFKGDKFELFGVDRAETAEKVKWFAKKMKVTYPLILDEESDVFTLFAKKEAGVTRNVIIDKEGKIVYLTRLFKEDEFNAMIDKIASMVE